MRVKKAAMLAFGVQAMILVSLRFCAKLFSACLRSSIILNRPSKWFVSAKFATSFQLRNTPHPSRYIVRTSAGGVRDGEDR